MDLNWFLGGAAAAYGVLVALVAIKAIATASSEARAARRAKQARFEREHYLLVTAARKGVFIRCDQCRVEAMVPREGEPGHGFHKQPLASRSYTGWLHSCKGNTFGYGRLHDPAAARKRLREGKT